MFYVGFDYDAVCDVCVFACVLVVLLIGCLCCYLLRVFGLSVF